MAEDLKDLENILRVAVKVDAATSKVSVGIERLGFAAKAANDQVGKLSGSLTSAFLGAAKNDTQSIITGLSGVADVFATAVVQAGGFKAAIVGLTAEALPLITTLGPLALGLAAVGGAAWAVSSATEQHEKRIKALHEAIEGQNRKLSEAAPWLIKTADNAFLASEGQKNFEKYLAKTNGTLEQQILLMRQATIEGYRKDLQDAKVNQKKAQTEFDRISTSGAHNATIGGFSTNVGGFSTFSAAPSRASIEQSDKYKSAKKDLSTANDNVSRSQGLLDGALKVPKDEYGAAFAGQATQAEKLGGALDQLLPKLTQVKRLQESVGIAQHAVDAAGRGDMSLLKSRNTTVEQAREAIAAGNKQIADLQKNGGPGGADRAARAAAGRADNQDDSELRQAAAAELAAQQSAARSAEQIAEIKVKQIEQELQGQRTRLQGLVEEKKITGGAADAAIASYERVADIKKAVAAEQFFNDQLARRRALEDTIAGYTDRQVQSQIALATSLEDAQAIENKAIAERRERAQDRRDFDLFMEWVDGKKTEAEVWQVQDAAEAADLGDRAVKAQADRVAIINADLKLRQSALQNVIDIAQSEADLARSAGRRREIEAGILKARHDLQVASIDAAILTTKDLDARAQLIKDREAADSVYANQVEASQRLDVSYGDMSSALKNAASALEQKDWLGATKSLFDAFETFTLKMSDSGATLESKIGAIAGLANGLGSMIGGKTGAALSGAGSGAAAGFQMGGPWGAAVGAVLGGVSGLLGASNAKAQAKVDALVKAQQDLQAKQKESSGAIEKSLGLASQYQNSDLDYSNAMLASLRSIDAQIGVVAAGVARSIAGGGLMSTSGLGLGTTTSKGNLGIGLGAGALTGAALAGGASFLMSGFAGALTLGPIGLVAGAVGAIIGALAKTKKTVEVLDQGLTFTAQTFGQLSTSGLAGSQYADLLTTKKTSVAGIGLSTKVSTSTVTSGADPALLAQIGGTIQLLGEGVITAAKTFGDDAGAAAKAALQAVSIDLGKLSLKGLKPDEIEAAINALFNNVADDLAAAGLPGLQALAKAGEGAFEALTRLATEYKTIDAVLASVGMDFKSGGVGSLNARKGLLEQFGGLDAFASQTAFFGEHFLTAEDRLKPLKTSVTSGLAAIGQPADLSREGFKTLVQSQNLSTPEGAELYAALMKLAPAFDKVTTAAEAAKEAVADKKTSILDQIDELTMSPAQLLEKSRAKEMEATKKLGVALVPLLEQLYDLQDAAKVDEKRKSIQDQIDDLVLTPAALLTKSRAAEMEAVKALDATLVPFLEKLWKLQDAAEAAKLAADRSNMLAGLMEAQGRTEEAKQLRRSLALAQIKDPVQKMYQEQAWAAEDAAAKVSAARDVLTQAYQREQEAIQATKDKFKELSTSLRAFSASLTDTIAGTDPGTRYRRSREAFLSTAAMARLGDADAMGRLQGEGEAFTAASRDYVSTSLDYLRDVGLVREAVDEAANTADRQASIAEQQLEALNKSVQGLIEISANVVSVRDAIASLQAAYAQAQAAGVGSVGGVAVPGTPGKPVDNSSNAATSDGFFIEGDTNDYDFHVEMRRRLDAQMQANRDMGYEKWREKQEATAAEGEAWLDSVWGGYPGAYREAQDRWNTAAGITPDYRESWTEDDWRAVSGLPRNINGVLYANGGAFTNGVVTRPTAFNLGLMGEAGPEAIMPLTRTVSGALGVRAMGSASNDDNLIQELRRLREELADLRATSARIATSNDKMERTLTNVTEGGRAMQTQAAA